MVGRVQTGRERVAYFAARAIGKTSMYEVTLHRNREEQERMRLRATQMRELIRPPQTVVQPNATVQDMTRVFLEYPVKYLYVTDDSGCFLGVVALKDITSDLLDKRDTERLLGVTAPHWRRALRETLAALARTGGTR